MEVLIQQVQKDFQVKNLRVFKKSRKIEMVLAPKSFESLRKLRGIEEGGPKALGVDTLAVKLEIEGDFWPYLKELLFLKFPGFTGFLRGETVSWHNDIFEIVLNDMTAVNWLRTKKVNITLENLYKEYFDRDIRIRIEEAKECIRDEEGHCFYEEEAKLVKALMEGMTAEANQNTRSEKKPDKSNNGEKQEHSSGNGNSAGDKKTNGFSGDNGFQKKSEGGKSADGENKFRRKRDETPDPGYIIGKKFNDELTPINKISLNSGKVAVEGQIVNFEIKTFASGSNMVIFNISDFTNAITCKSFLRNEEHIERLREAFDPGKVKKGMFARVQGDIRFDQFDGEIVLQPKAIYEVKRESRKDKAEKKRMELHAHTTMSALDAICNTGDLVKKAYEFGHPGIAITDHGVVQAFPEAYETWKGLKANAKKAEKDFDFKVVYGVEGYLAGDTADVVHHSISYDLNEEFVVFDLETTGLSPVNDRITEIGAVVMKRGEISSTYNKLVNPEMKIPTRIVELTGITDDMVKDQDTIDRILPEFLEFVGDRPIVAHNADFDWSFIRTNCGRLNIKYTPAVVDTLQLSRIMLKELKRHKLDTLCRHFKINLENHHRASDDATAAALVFRKLLELASAKGAKDLMDLNELNAASDRQSDRSNHIIILVKNMVGLKNLYQLISASHLDHYYRKPLIPKSKLAKFREGLVIGSACEAGELYQSILKSMEPKKVKEILDFYDYIEIQPDGNNSFLLRNGTFKDIEQLRDITRKLYALGEEYGKPVVATGDVHFIEPEDEIYRRIIMSGQGFSDADQQAPLYLRTTEDMLKEFEYLGYDEARKVVIENPKKVLDMIDEVQPIPDGTFAPIIKGSDEEIRNMTYNKAKSMYGDVLPEVVEARLERELGSIIKHGFSVMYLIAQKLVSKSLADGYLVGSRGSVGSSLVATMTDITEVNPLPPHYRCPKCKRSEFLTDGMYGSGAEMPYKDCPECGTKFIKDGFDIPFETFLGFDGDKEPDIDLNFAGEYQPVAHAYTEELFGKGYVFRAGTIGTIAEKTAFGFVKKYFDEKEIKLHKAEYDRIAKGCTGIKRTTGQHPGGIMVVPDYKDIHDFTPIQRPADDQDTSTITTHFDYHSISGRILKLDILGHDVPTIIKMLEDLTGFSVFDVPLDDPETMSLFTKTDALNADLSAIDCNVGSLGIPEFGTKFVRGMLNDTMPTTLSELVRISGLSHGTDVWLNNAQDYVRDGTASLKEVISTRDDIMVYLMYQGLAPKLSFTIMEKVRKGKKLDETELEAMHTAGVPQWYIDSCVKIKYMFPKAHAAAYVMMSFRIAYYKVHYPEAYYATYFYIKVSDFDADLAVKGKDMVLARWKEIEKLGNAASTKEKDQAIILELVYEMYQRGIKLLPVDLKKSDSKKFQLADGGILPPFLAIQGIGENAAISVLTAREESPFISIGDLRERTKLTKTNIDTLRSHGCLKDLPESNQLSLFG